MAIFKCNNDQCASKGKLVTIVQYWIKPNPLRYYGKGGKRIVCSECKQPLVLQDEPFNGMTTSVAFFSSMSSQQKKEVLKKRANEHFRRNTDGMRDYRDYIERESGGK